MNILLIGRRLRDSYLSVIYRVLDEHPVDEVLELRADVGVLGEDEVLRADLVVERHHVVVVERHLAGHQGEQGHAQGPDVGSLKTEGDPYTCMARL